MEKNHAYAGKILRIDLTAGRVSTMPTEAYAESFVGGRGMGTKIYWEEVRPETGALDPENALIFVTGPVTGCAPAGSRWQIYGKSPASFPERFCYTHLGGSWGAFLKFAGFDAMVIRGRAERPTYIFVKDGTVEIRDAAALWGQGATQVRDTLKAELGDRVRVVATGPAGENGIRFAGLLADQDASGSSGFGAVMGSKNLKAIAVTGSGKIKPADREAIQSLTREIRSLLGQTVRLDPAFELPPDIGHEKCFACMGCHMRGYYELPDGTKGKYACGAGAFYHNWVRRYYGELNHEVPFRVERLCDQYSLDVYPVVIMMIWIELCVSRGVLKEESLGLPVSKIGSLEFMESFVKLIARRQGFGDLLAEGPARAAEQLGGPAEKLLEGIMSDSLGHPVSLDPRLLLYTGLAYAMEPRWASTQLAEILGRGGALWCQWAEGVPGSYLSSDVLRAISGRFWGGELSVDFSTYQGKALVAKIIQDRVYGTECLPLCSWMFPISDSEYTEDHVGDPTIESRLLTAVTGKRFDEQGLYRIGERVFNLQRAVLAREGHVGRESDKLPDFYHSSPLSFDGTIPSLLVPGKDGEVISRKGAIFERDKFEQMKDEFYALREWDVTTGFQTREKLEELGLGEIVDDLENRQLLAN